MKKRNWKLMGLCLALALLCVCLFGGAALAANEVELNIDSDWGGDVDGVFTVPLHGGIDYHVHAPGASLVEIFFGDDGNEQVDYHDDPEDDEYGWGHGGWGFHDQEVFDGQETGTHDYTVYARAKFGTKWVKSNEWTIRVVLDSTLEGPLQYTVLNRDAMQDSDGIYIEVQPVEGANYFEAYIGVGEDEDYHDLVWTGWTDANPDGVTTLRLPVTNCDPGDYEVNVYAGRFGARNLDDERGTKIKVTAPASEEAFIFGMKDTYTTQENLGVSVRYTTPVSEIEGYSDTDEVWMDVQLRRVGDDEDEQRELDVRGPERDRLYIFAEDWIDESGDYLVEPRVWRRPQGGEPELVDSDTHAFTVTSSGKLSLTAPALPDKVQLGGEDLAYTMTMPENAEYMETWIHVEGWGDDDFLIFENEPDKKGNLKSTLTQAILAEREVRPGDVLVVHGYTSGSGYDKAEWERKIPVVGQEGEAGSTTIVFADFEGSEIDTQVNTDIDIVITPEAGREVCGIQLYGGYDYRDIDIDDDEGDGTYREGVSFGDEGTFSIFARVTYEPWQEEWDGIGNLQDPRAWVTTNVLRINVAEPVGQVGRFTISTDRNSATRGESAIVHFTRADNAEDYELCIDPVDEDGHGIDLDFDRRWDWYDEGRAILYTATMPAGRYSLHGEAKAAGYSAFHTEDIYFTVNEPEDLTEDNFLFTLNGESNEVDLVTSQRFQLEGYAPGADSIEVFLNFGYDDEWRDDWGGDSFSSDRRDYPRPGDYNLVARAWYPEFDDNGDPVIDDEGDYAHHYRDSEPIIAHVTAANGSLVFGEIESPDSILPNTAFQASVPMPENAEKMEVNVWVEGREDSGLFDDEIRREEGDDRNAVDVSIDADRISDMGLKAGDSLHLRAWASALDYEEEGIDILIPVIEGKTTRYAQLTVEGGEVENGVLNVLANNGTEYIFRVAATGNHTLRAVQLYHDDWWDDRRTFTPNNEDDADYFDDGDFVLYHDYYDARKLTVYARVQLDKSATWYETNRIVVNASHGGFTGPFAFADTNTVRVARGENAQFTLTPAENATYYWIDVVAPGDDDGENNQDWREEDGNIVITLDTMKLEPGEYKIRGCADARGLQRTEATNMAKLVVTEYEGNDIQLSVSNTSPLTNERQFINVYAPGAVRIGFAVDGERWDLNEDGEYQWDDSDPFDYWEHDDLSFNDTDTHTLVGYAQYEDDGEWVPSNVVQVKASAPNGRINLNLDDVPMSVEEGQDIDFLVPWPWDYEGAEYLDYDWNPAGEDERRYSSENGSGNDLNVHINGDELVGVDAVYIGIWTGGVGYEHHHYNVYIPINPSPEVTVAMVQPQNTYYANTGYDVHVTAPGADAVKINGGYGYWRNDDGSFEYPMDGNEYNFGVNYNRADTYQIYVMARINNVWKPSNTVTIDVESNGPAPTTDVNVPEYVFAGSDAVIGVANPGESWYHIGVHPVNEDNIYDYQYGDDETSGDVTRTVDAALLEAGKTYQVSVWFARDGYDENEVKKTFEVVQPHVKLTTAKQTYKYGETVALNVDAPLADSVELYRNDAAMEGNEWVVNATSGEFTFRAVAHYGNQTLEDAVTISVKSAGPAPIPTVTMPRTIHEGETLTVKVSNTQGVTYRLALDGVNKTKKTTYTLSGLAAGTHTVTLTCAMTGYELNVATFKVSVHPVITEEAVAPTCDADGHTEGTYCLTCKKYLTTYEVLPALGHDWQAVTYTWSSDYKRVTAQRVCGNDADHVEKQTVGTTWKLTTSPTETTNGKRKYTTKAFSNSAFAVKSKTVADIPALNSLQCLKLPAALQTIEEEAFAEGAFQAVIIPDGCQSIDRKAFRDCDNLIYIRIPASVTYIAYDAFEGCGDVIIDRK